MPLQTFKTREEVPADQIEQAVEAKDGTFYVFRDEDTSGLKTALQKEREARKSAEAAAAKAAEAAQQTELKEKGLLEAKQKWDSEHLAPVKERLSTLEQENRALKLTGPAKEIFRKVGIIDPDDPWARYGSELELSEKGTPMLKSDPTADLEKWAAGLKEKHPQWFDGTHADGGDARGGRGKGPSASIPAGDQKAFLANVDKIASGDVAVR